MLVSVRWLEELLHYPIELEKLKKISLTLGFEVENENALAPAPLLIGKITKAELHPRTRNLTILQVKINRTITIVTAAKNVKEGDLVLVGTAGTEFNKEKITERTFQGVVSQGILISEEELGIAEKSSGVIVLQKGKEGSVFQDVFDNIVVELKTTPNRPDWLSVEGIARDLALALDIPPSQLKLSTSNSKPRQSNAKGAFAVRIKDMQGCPRYTARIFENITVTESPFWMKWRLHSMGMNSVNNVVDATNIIMLLTGQPLHPFDLDLLKGGIIVRKARNGERFMTLEKTPLTLTSDDLVISDKEGAIALGGIIGSTRAQISEKTSRVLLESAYFNNNRIAHTARRLGLNTEASVRFEEGADLAIVDNASALTGEWFTTYARAREKEFIGVGKKAKPIRVTFSRKHLNTILSLDLTTTQIKKILKKINISITGSQILKAEIPHYRRDITIAEDVFEEIARLYGYRNIPEIEPDKWGGSVTVRKDYFHETLIINVLLGAGYSETYNLSLVPSTRLVELGYETFATIMNPLNERFNALRPSLFVGLLDTVNHNLAQGNRSLKFYEIGNILLPQEPFQEKRLGFVLGGKRYPEHWKQKDEELDFYDLKGTVENIFHILHVQNINYKKTTKQGLKETLAISIAGKELGYLGCIDPKYCKGKYYYAEFNLEKLLSLISQSCYMSLPRYPANTRDLSFLLGHDVGVPELMIAIQKVGGPVLEKVILFDYYKGKNLPPNMKNLGFRLFFRAPDRTLLDKEVDVFIKKIESEITSRFNAVLRKKE